MLRRILTATLTLTGSAFLISSWLVYHECCGELGQPKAIRVDINAWQPQPGPVKPS